MKMLQIVMTIALVAFVAFSSSHAHVSQTESVSVEHGQMDHDPNPMKGSHSDTCRVHVACSLTATPAQTNLLIAMPLPQVMTLPFLDLFQPSAASLTETPPPRA